MHTPLAVRISDGTTDRHVTRHVRGLRFTKTAPGGHHSASLRLTLPRSAFTDLGPADRLWVYDKRTSRTVWEGYTENPGTSDGTEGQGFSLAAMGGMVRLRDMSKPVVFMERSLDPSLWLRINDTGGGDQVIDGGVLKLQFNAGMPVGTGSTIRLNYYGLTRTGQRLAAAESQIVAGKTDAGYWAEIVATDEGVAEYVAAGNTFSTTQGPIGGQVITSFPATCETVGLRTHRTGAATNVTDDATWGAFLAPYIRPILKNASGADITSGFSTPWVYAHEVVWHLLGSGMMPQVDGPTARVDAGAYQITQLTYHDGATPGQILDDLALYEPDLLWEVLETNTSGKHRYNYRAWPTTPRYEISTRDGYTAPGGDVDLCNRVVVYWTDPQGARQSTVVSATSATYPALKALEDAGITHDAESVTLPDGLGSAPNAQRIGEQVLAAKANPPKAARARVGRPLLDLDTGRRVLPWEIEPGYLVRVRETGDLLRLTEMEYVDDDAAAYLTLGEPVLTMDQRLARLKVRI